MGEKLQESALVKARHAIGLYSISELTEMFGMSRFHLDNALNLGELKYISPNNKTRFIYLQDYLEYLNLEKKKVKEVRECW